jgi:hypothetical protein
VSAYDDDRARAQARYLSRLEPGTEVRVYLGAGPAHAKSVYKAFTRRGEGWWRWDLGRHGVPHPTEPPAPRGVNVVACTMADLAAYECDETRLALAALFRCARGLT